MFLYDTGKCSRQKYHDLWSFGGFSKLIVVFKQYVTKTSGFSPETTEQFSSATKWQSSEQVSLQKQPWISLLSVSSACSKCVDNACHGCRKDFTLTAKRSFLISNNTIFFAKKESPYNTLKHGAPFLYIRDGLTWYQTFLWRKDPTEYFQ